MKQRILTAIVAILVLVVILFFKGILLRPATILVGLMGLYEFYGAFKNKYKIMYVPAFLISLLNYYLLIVNDIYNSSSEKNLCFIFISLILFLIIVFMKAVFNYDKYDTNSLMVTILGYLYTTVLFSFIYMLATLGTFGKESLFYLLLLFAISWGTDIGGYTIGCLLGKHKLCEKLSPKKTYEGSIGGIIFSLIFAFVLIIIYNTQVGLFDGIEFFSVYEPVNMIITAVGIIVLSLFAQIGDFIASSFKRFVNIKDYSNIMPGHGGIIDRFDSVLFVAPVLYLLIVFFI